MKNTVCSAASMVVLCCGGMTSMAMDVGDPVFKQDVPSGIRLEVIYEDYDRDAELDYENVTFSGPGGSFSISPEDSESSTESDVVTLRGTFFTSEKVSVFGDFGLLDDEDGEDLATVLGGGVRVLAYQKDQIRLTVFGTAHYVLPYDIESDEFDPDDGPIESTGEVDYYELTAGALLSGDIKLDDHTTLVPYISPALSILRGDIDAELNYPALGVNGDIDIEIEEEDPFQLVIGGSLLFLDNWSIRVEGRVIGDSSVSGALGVAF